MFEKEKENLESEKERIEREEAEIYERYIETLKRAKNIEELDELRNSMRDDKSKLFSSATILAILVIVLNSCWYIVFLDKVIAMSTLIYTGSFGAALLLVLGEEPLINYLSTRDQLKNHITPEMLEDEQHKDQINEEVNNLREELDILRKKIKKINKELKKVKIKEELFRDENFHILNAYFERKLQEKSKEVAEKKLWCEKELEEYLNERIDYTDISLEVNPYEENTYKNCSKNLTKMLSKN